MTHTRLRKFNTRDAYPDYGVSLGWVYVIWVFVVFVLYWPCHWYAGVKQRNKSVWLSYL